VTLREEHNVRVGENLNELRRSLAGPVIGPADAGYDAARRCFNALVERRPAVIARCIGTGDVAAAFDFARAHELEVAVRGGGHNPAGHCVLNDGLVIDLSLMRTVDVDGNAGIARAGGGATWLDFDSATQAFGLVSPGGVVGSNRRLWAHPRRRDWSSDRAARPDVRQPRRRRGRDSRWNRHPRE
jgi:FAD binding domain